MKMLRPYNSEKQNMIETEDRYIIQKCLDGETEAFGFLVDRYRESVYALAHSKLHNSHDAEDITQKVFIKAYQKLRTLKQWDNMHAWLYSITANMCKDWIKVQSRRPDRSFIEDQDPKTIESITADTQEDPMIETLNEALESLPEIYRQVLTLYYLGGRDNKEIAKFLGISPDSVRQRLTRARSLLKEEMIAMMGKTFETQRLPIGFTFRIIEAVKRIKIDPVSIGKGVPWGLSLATGLLIAILGLNPQFMKMVQIDLTNLAVSGESSVLETGDFPVDIAKISENPFLANQEGANNGKSASDNPLIQNAFLLAPQGEGGTWAKKADMPTGRGNLVTSVVNGKIYAIGGFIWGQNFSLSATEEYDPLTDTWKKKADILTPRDGPAIGLVDGKIYVIGGAWVRSEVEVYDPQTDKWEKKADMPTGRGYLSANVVNGKIYAIGGYDGNNVFSMVEVYNPKTDTWEKKTNMPTARAYFSTSVVNNKIYAIGGLGDNCFPTVEEYDPVTDKWTKKANMPTARGAFTACVVNNKIYAIGGQMFGVGNYTNVVEVYDPATDKWEKEANMPTARGYYSACEVNGKIYVIGGSTIQQPGNDVSTVEEYTPEDGQSVSPQGKLPKKWGEIKK
jgi:RNA polymerase sigma factor (sigma-70 family)